jgi:hypothetical protein
MNFLRDAGTDDPDKMTCFQNDLNMTYKDDFAKVKMTPKNYCYSVSSARVIHSRITSSKMTAAQMLLNCKGNSGQDDLLKMTFPKMTAAQMLLNCKGNSGYRMNFYR